MSEIRRYSKVVPLSMTRRSHVGMTGPSRERRGMQKQQRSITGTYNICHGLGHTNKATVFLFR